MTFRIGILIGLFAGILLTWLALRQRGVRVYGAAEVEQLQDRIRERKFSKERT